MFDRLAHRFDRLTPQELLEARESEATYESWLADVKNMMIAGEEEGLAMALCQTMQEAQKKDELLGQRTAELKALRAERAREVGRRGSSANRGIRGWV